MAGIRQKYAFLRFVRKQANALSRDFQLTLEGMLTYKPAGMTNPRTLTYSSVARHCEKLRSRLSEYDRLKADYEFYQKLLASFDDVEADLDGGEKQDSKTFVPDPKSQKGIAYMIISNHPRGISQADIIIESAKYGPMMKASSLSSQLSQMKKKHLIKKVGRLYMLKK